MADLESATKDEAIAVVVFQAFTGGGGSLSDNVGRLEVGKKLCFQHYIKAKRNIAKALMTLCEDHDLTQEVKDKLLSCICLRIV